jgi:adenylate cyclase
MTTPVLTTTSKLTDPIERDQSAATVLDKYIGDGIMGLFGAIKHEPNDGNQDVVDAVRAAVELRKRFNGILPKWRERWTLYTPHKIEIGLACGLHTGDVLVGNVGTELRDQYTALGPNVNFAQRIEARAGMGASTRARLGDQFEFQDSSTVTDIKNIPGEFKLFSVTGVS